MHCRSCGRQLPDNAAFCGQCGTPVRPVSPETPASPATPETSDTPASPVTPEASDTPVTPETSDTPASPVTPERSDTPASPVTPETSDTSDTPVTPETSDTSDTPASLDTPTSLDTPETSDTPTSLDTPTATDTSAAPSSLDTPTMTDTPASLDAHTTPDISAAPISRSEQSRRKPGRLLIIIAALLLLGMTATAIWFAVQRLEERTSPSAGGSGPSAVTDILSPASTAEVEVEAGGESGLSGKARLEMLLAREYPEWTIIATPELSGEGYTVVDDNGQALNCRSGANGDFICEYAADDSIKENTAEAEPTVEPTEAPISSPMAEVIPTESIDLLEDGVKLSRLDGMRQVLVKEGTFLLGANEGDALANADERPQRELFVDSYWIDETEVTNEQFARFLSEIGGHQDTCLGRRCMKTDDEQDLSHISRSSGSYRAEAGYENHPVIMVSWYGAAAYCQWAGRRLPTEVEWEKAARGDDGRQFPWGDQLDGSRANWCEASCEISHRDPDYEDGYALTAPVGSYPSGMSLSGALDMAGNVSEYVSDWYGEKTYGSLSSTNPQGPSTGSLKVRRGGSWISDAADLRVTTRGKSTADSLNNNVGFRCAETEPSR